MAVYTGTGALVPSRGRRTRRRRMVKRTLAMMRTTAITAAPAAQIHPRSSRGLIFSA